MYLFGKHEVTLPCCLYSTVTYTCTWGLGQRYVPDAFLFFIVYTGISLPFNHVEE